MGEPGISSRERDRPIAYRNATTGSEAVVVWFLLFRLLASALPTSVA